MKWTRCSYDRLLTTFCVYMQYFHYHLFPRRCISLPEESGHERHTSEELSFYTSTIIWSRTSRKRLRSMEDKRDQRTRITLEETEEWVYGKPEISRREFGKERWSVLRRVPVEREDTTEIEIHRGSRTHNNACPRLLFFFSNSPSIFSLCTQMKIISKVRQK